MKAERFLALLTSMNIWRRGQERAPHKPLLLLLALGDLGQGHARLRPYTEIAAELQDLLKRFGPPRRSYHPEHPFLRLTKDGLWEIQGLPPSHLDRSGQLHPAMLRHSQIKGGLPAEVYQLLHGNPALRKQAVEYLLSSHFPEGLHQELLEAVNLHEILNPLAATDKILRPRDPRFRNNVLRAYEYRCAICGYDIRLDDRLMGLEAAHIQWHASGGPDAVPNGLALCVVHHRAFDRGGIGLEDTLELLVSDELHGQNEAWHFWFLQYAGQPIRRPRQSKHEPEPKYLAWHRRQVFRDLP